MLAAKFDHCSIDQHHLHAEQVVGCHAIFQTVGAAGIHADVAADRAGKLRTRIGRIEEALGRDGVGDAEIGHASLDGCGTIGRIDLEYPRHLREPEDDRIFLRDRPSREGRARAPRNDRNTVAVAILHHRRHLFRRLRQDNSEWQSSIGYERISLERHKLTRFVHQAFRWQDIREIRDNRRSPRHDSLAWLKKLYGIRHGTPSRV